MDTRLAATVIAGLIVLLVAAGFALLLRTIRSLKERPSLTEEMAGIYTRFGAFVKSLDGIGSGQKELGRNLHELQRSLDAIKTDYEARKNVDEATRESIKRLEHIIAGTKAKGMAGENVLREIFRLLPQEMIVSGFRVKGKEVEFGLLLSNGKVVPIDSKWVATDLLSSLAHEEDSAKQEALTQAIERELLKRVNEVAQYIDPVLTSSLAVAAVPDAAYAVCKSAHVTAYKRGVVLIPYSMVLPYLLMFFNLHLQFSSTVDVENIFHYLIDIKRALDTMDDTLENKVMRAKVMIENAANDYRFATSSIKSSIKQIESVRDAKRPLETVAPGQG